MVFIFKLLIPFLYIAAAIVTPVYLFNTDYGWSVLIGFWIPIFILLFVVLSKVEPAMRKAFIVTILIFIPVTFVFEYLCLVFDIWNFYEGYSKLWGIRIAGAPIEEFVFWFGATPLCLLVYLYYASLFRGKL